MRRELGLGTPNRTPRDQVRSRMPAPGRTDPPSERSPLRRCLMRAATHAQPHAPRRERGRTNRLSPGRQRSRCARTRISSTRLCAMRLLGTSAVCCVVLPYREDGSTRSCPRISRPPARIAQERSTWLVEGLIHLRRGVRRFVVSFARLLGASLLVALVVGSRHRPCRT